MKKLGLLVAIGAFAVFGFVVVAFADSQGGAKSAAQVGGVTSHGAPSGDHSAAESGDHN